MRLVSLAAFACLASALPAQAALPPQYQRQVELRAIIDNEAIVEAFGVNELINAIELISQDHYRVTSDSCTMDVTIIDAKTKHEAGFVGPRQFAVEPGPIACK